MFRAGFNKACRRKFKHSISASSQSLVKNKLELHEVLPVGVPAVYLFPARESVQSLDQPDDTCEKVREGVIRRGEVREGGGGERRRGEQLGPSCCETCLRSEIEILAMLVSVFAASFCACSEQGVVGRG